jgi:ABC-type multidrug transport system permease subunit
MRSQFDYEKFRVYGWIALGISVIGILLPGNFGVSEMTGSILFFSGFVIFTFGVLKSLTKTD